MTPRTIDIAGGGVAGLALGLALRQHEIPVRVHEAGIYPRHRLCGEFLSGAGPREFALLGVEDIMEDAVPLQEAAWFLGDRCLLRRPLPEPALGISRWQLDAAMARRLVERGGEVLCEARVRLPLPAAEGWVSATGRPVRMRSPWMAQKAHYQNFDVTAGLEMHLGRGAYAGIARVENDTVNVCALLPDSAGKQPGSLPDRLRACGMAALAKRLEAATPLEGTGCGIAHFTTGHQQENGDAVAVGDHFAIIPPFAGHGLSMAMVSALEAAPFLTAWSRSSIPWATAASGVRSALRRKFRRRLRWAAWLHPVLLRAPGQSALRLFASAGLLPWRWLYQKVR